MASTEPNLVRSGESTAVPGSLHVPSVCSARSPLSRGPQAAGPPPDNRGDSCQKDKTVDPAIHLNLFLFPSLLFLIVIFLLGLLIKERPKSLVI